MNPADEKWIAKFSVIKDNIFLHAAEEETTYFP